MSCKYCDLWGWLDIDHNPRDVMLIVDGTTAEIRVEVRPEIFGESYCYMATAPISFCPMCGERLRDENGEMTEE